MSAAATAAPERIWLEPTGIREGWTGRPDQIVDGDVEYVRADIAVTARAVAIAALEEWERWTKDQFEGCSVFDSEMARIAEQRALIGGAE